MAKPTIRDFLENRNLIALKFSSSELSGVFQKRFTLPRHTTGLAMFSDGAVRRMEAGEEARGRFDLLIAKEGDLPLRFAISGLRSADDYPLSAQIDMTVRLQCHRDDLLKDFARSYFNFPGAYSTSDMKAALGADLKRIASEFAAPRTAAELHKRDLRPHVEETFRPRIERLLFGTGVSLIRMGDVVFESPDFACRAAAEARREEELRRHQEKLARKEERVRRIAEFLQDASMRELLDKIPDARAKGLLYAKLMEDDSITLTPRDLAGRFAGSDELSRLITRTLEELLSTSSGISALDLECESAGRIYGAAGSKILEINPRAPEDAPREFNFKDPLRSVRVAEVDGVPALLVGCKRTAHIVMLGRDVEHLEFPFPDDRPPRGGVNAVALNNGHLFATHSEFGLARWDRSKPGAPGDLLYQPLTSRNRTTRGVLVAGSRIAFSSGSAAYVAPREDGAAPIAFQSGLDGPVTSLAVAGDFLYAATDAGSIVAWKLDEPDHPTLLVRRKDPIGHLRIVRMGAIPHLLYTARDPAVRARVIGQPLETSYESGGIHVGALDASSDLICASDTPGRRLFLWKTGTPGRPFHVIDLSRYSEKPLLDVGMSKVKIAT